ncbi:MAG: Rpp14/Pop5 family protein [Candidatus Thermoplasmatota archaeon]
MPHIVKGVRRHRYIALNVICEQPHPLLTKADFIQALRRHALELFSRTTQDLGLWVVQFDGTQGIVKCHYTEKDHVRHLVQSLQTIGFTPVRITTRSTSGTIRGLTKKKPMSR